MPMNYCPYCGAKIDSNQKYCPNCGSRIDYIDGINKAFDEEESSLSVPPKDPSWVDKWRKRANVGRIVDVLLFFVLFLPIFIMTCYYKFNSPGDILDVVFWFLIVLYIGLFALTIVSVMKRKLIVTQIEGYTIVLFRKRSQNALIVEDEIINSQALYHSRYSHTPPHNLYGSLPNGTKIYANFEDKTLPVGVYIDDKNY